MAITKGSFSGQSEEQRQDTLEFLQKHRRRSGDAEQHLQGREARHAWTRA